MKWTEQRDRGIFPDCSAYWVIPLFKTASVPSPRSRFSILLRASARHVLVALASGPDRIALTSATESAFTSDNGVETVSPSATHR